MHKQSVEKKTFRVS